MPEHEKLPPERNLRDVILEIKEELREFYSTRMEMFRSEFQETAQGWKSVIALSSLALVFLGTAYFLFTLALVSIVVVAFWDNPYHWFFAFLIIGFVWSVAGGLLAFFARVTYRNRAMFPKRSLGVLQADRTWLQTEARGHL
jgi:uncharacterized membrane protein YqjE